MVMRFFIAVALVIILSGCLSQPDFSFKGCVVKSAESENSSTYVVFGPAVITVKRNSDAIYFNGAGIGYSYLYGHQLGVYQYDMVAIEKDANHLIEIKK